MNIQYAIANDVVYVLEANPRASRTVPLVSKVCNISMARIATQVMLGKKLADLQPQAPRRFRTSASRRRSSRSTCSPRWTRCSGPEMRSTGEVLGLADSFGLAFYKAQEAAEQVLPAEGHGAHHRRGRRQAGRAGDGQGVPRSWASRSGPPKGTHKFLADNGDRGRADPQDARGPAQHRRRHQERRDPAGHQHARAASSSKHDDSYIRKAAIKYKVPYITTIAAGRRRRKGIAAFRQGHGRARSLQSYHGDLK